MNEESKQGAPDGASAVCEICGREECYRWAFPTTGYSDGKCECYRLGYERLRSSLSTAEKARDEAEVCVEQLVGDVQAVSRDYTDALNALRGVEWGGEAGHWEEAGCPECREGERFGHRAGCKLSAALYGSDTTDALKAPKSLKEEEK